MSIKAVPNQNCIQKTLASTFAASATSCTLSEDISALLSTVSEDNPGVFVVDRVDSNGTATPTKREYCTFTGVSTTTLSGITRNADSSGSDQEHSTGAVVEFVMDALWGQSVVDTFDVEHDADGTHDTTKVVDLTTAQTLTNKTLTSPKINEDVALTSTATELNLLHEVTALVTASSTDTLTNKTLTSPVINTGLSGTAKASGAEVTTGTADDKFVTPKAIGDAGINTRLASKIITGTRDMTAASGDVDYTGVGFQPTAVIAIANVDGNYQHSIGISDSSVGEYCVSPNAANALYQRSTLIWLETGGAAQSAVVKQYGSDGFTLTWTKANSPSGTAKIIFLCFR
jgi:hypothetical protein